MAINAHRIRRISLLSALLVAVLILAWRQGIFNSFDFFEDEPEIPPILLAIREADQIADPYLRCLQYPQPRGIQWPQSLIEAFCADELTPIPDYYFISRSIIEGREEEVEHIFNNLVNAYFDGRLAERALWRAYARNFAYSTESVAQLTESWLAQSPWNAHANIARGLYLLGVAADARGGEVIADTPEERLIRMDHFLDSAIEKLQKGLRLNPKIMPAYSALIDAARLGGDDQLAEATYAKALSIDPGTYYVRTAMQRKVERRWGGSYIQIDNIAEKAKLFIAINPRLAGLSAIAIGSRAFDLYFYKESPSENKAMAYLERALVYAPTFLILDFAADSAEELGDCLRSVELYSQALRFNPDNSRVRRDRAECISEMGMEDWALSEYQKALADNPSDQSAIREYVWLLMQQDKYDQAAKHLARLVIVRPTDDWVLRQLAEIYLYNQRRFDLADPVINRLLKLNPKDGGAWLLRVDLLHDTGSAGVRKAMRQFIRYADENSLTQRKALVKIKAWLTEHSDHQDSP